MVTNKGEKMEGVLPGIKSKRRNIKPPRPNFWIWLFFVIAHIASAIFNIVIYAMGGAIIGPIIALSFFFLGMFIAPGVWWLFLREVEIWKRDNGE
jgi:hypothetical protein